MEGILRLLPVFSPHSSTENRERMQINVNIPLGNTKQIIGIRNTLKYERFIVFNLSKHGQACRPSRTETECSAAEIAEAVTIQK